ncbi:hypothetical protein NIAMH_2 [Serratia phage vB_SmaS_Niamh]|uniref:Uncharacterized protein n=1 Tax=Serratia phage vB_SmaS_Ulliraptor TaxID=2902694 RepID=A0AC61TNV2_9CAUD|nr:hypothetical protein QJS27_gp02 [Serratia phage vB_SmaS_Ulliraptor]QPX74422.1 hypothetical protein SERRATIANATOR_66 [Serratia phage vB_SmaS_Serratianator]UGO51994.1 hypothetical protein ULLIRAPTOR_2 [Serratia phage vB_SmaS_Ulliraptor]UGO52956.1 hypothetical protein NIAMH_2 [Serratia phage vB_SmaS_Niamh]
MSKVTREQVIQAHCNVTRIEFMLVNGTYIFAQYGIVFKPVHELTREFDLAYQEMLYLRAEYRRNGDN